MRGMWRPRGRYRGMMSALWVALTVLLGVIESKAPTAHLTIISPRHGGGTWAAATAGSRQRHGGRRIEGWRRGWITGREDRGDRRGGGIGRWPGAEGGGGRGERNGAPGHRGPRKGVFGSATPRNGHGRGGRRGGGRHPGSGSRSGKAPPPTTARAAPPTAPAPRPTAPAPPLTAPPAQPISRVAGRRHQLTQRRGPSAAAPRAALTVKVGGSHSSVAAASAAPATRAHHAPTPPASVASRQTYSRVSRVPIAPAARLPLFHVAVTHAGTTPRTTQTHPSEPSPSTTASRSSGSPEVPPTSQRTVLRAWVSPAAAVGDRTLTPLLTLPAVVLLLPVLGLCVLGRRR
jgi:hypothetical protein